MNQEAVLFGDFHWENIQLYNRNIYPTHSPSWQHVHQSFEISFFEGDIEGKYVLVENGREYPFVPGDVFLFRSNERHCFCSDRVGQNAWCNGMHFFPELLWSTGNYRLNFQHRQFFSLYNTSFCNKVPRETRLAEKIRALMYQIKTEMDVDQTGSTLATQAYFALLLVELARTGETESKAVDLGKHGKLNEDSILRLEQARAYIESHLSEALTLSQVAAVAVMSPSYFSTQFKKMFGFSVWDFVISRRIDRARNLLESTAQSVLEIAQDCGFRNGSNFNRAFRRVMGCSPTEFRQRSASIV